ncbi:MAG: hypothetical protein M0007_15535, partial [Actinomycetota bacterium]|nr:hypothetical protein [Actinomycetota bacterium]
MTWHRAYGPCHSGSAPRGGALLRRACPPPDARAAPATASGSELRRAPTGTTDQERRTVLEKVLIANRGEIA